MDVTTLPVTTPDEVTVAIAVLLLPHVPPPPSLSPMAEPLQTLGLGGPPIGDGKGFTVIITESELLQPVEVIVSVSL